MKTKETAAQSFKELEVSFKVNFIPKSEASKEVLRGMQKEDVFGIQEIEIGKEDFMMVMGRTVITDMRSEK